ncbi:hypothetical protein IV203_001049 [Nitzschia inconspicua]|uniref:Uncharacterized protein n=1 Tax=Nitzschia inconspicua TaxID=303405 RepID=A0A9K3L6E5_9STRA|nr:hypothetical protein IV203_001049 [Nitzschia inconspicua]
MMSSFISRHKDVHHDVTAAVDDVTKSKKASRPRTNEDDDDASTHVTTMFPPRKKARVEGLSDDGAANTTMTEALTTWLASLGKFVKSTLRLETTTAIAVPHSNTGKKHDDGTTKSVAETTTATKPAASATKSTIQKTNATTAPASPKKSAAIATPISPKTKSSTKANVTPKTKRASKTAATSSATLKKPRQPRRCFHCMNLYGDEQMAIDCPGKQNRKRCLNASKA